MARVVARVMVRVRVARGAPNTRTRVGKGLLAACLTPLVRSLACDGVRLTSSLSHTVVCD